MIPKGPQNDPKMRRRRRAQNDKARPYHTSRDMQASQSMSSQDLSSQVTRPTTTQRTTGWNANISQATEPRKSHKYRRAGGVGATGEGTSEPVCACLVRTQQSKWSESLLRTSGREANPRNYLLPRRGRGGGVGWAHIGIMRKDRIRRNRTRYDKLKLVSASLVLSCPISFGCNL